jgi:hypothetical protein
MKRLANIANFTLAALALAASSAWAANNAPAGDATARYQQERASCTNGQSHEDRATCLREAGAALEEARKGNLNDGNVDYQRNAEQRCQRLPADDKEACLARMRGQGTVSGSVGEGGLLREYREVVPVPPTPPGPPPSQ